MQLADTLPSAPSGTGAPRSSVMPAKAGIHLPAAETQTPTFVGVTVADAQDKRIGRCCSGIDTM
jgi:hypothetical protein